MEALATEVRPGGCASSFADPTLGYEDAIVYSWMVYGDRDRLRAVAVAKNGGSEECGAA